MFSRTIRTWTAVVAGTALSGVLLVAPGEAADTSGRPVGWGWNAYGQVGNAAVTDSLLPVAVDTGGMGGGKALTTVSAGEEHTCAVVDGRAYCWGWNLFGQLGTNSTTDAHVPVPVDTSGPLAGKTITAISAGGDHTCAVADGRAYCWGLNGYGQLGNNNAPTASSSPVAVAATGGLAGKTVSAISAGASHTCAVADGRAYCWGYNSFGQLGDNRTTAASVPVAVDTSDALKGRTVSAISAGYDHTCAVADGRAYCWGSNFLGRSGNKTKDYSSVPVAVDTSGVLAGRTVTGISAGGSHTCAVADGRAYCWGSNGYGQVGDNSTTGADLPVAVDTSGSLAGRTVSSISAGLDHTCALAVGRAYCWGNNAYGQLGDNSTVRAVMPVPVGTLDGKTLTALDAGGEHTVALWVAVPQPPTGVSAVPGIGRVSVSWTPPSDDGGSPIIDYTATATPSGATCTTAGTTCAVSGLAEGTRYTFTVTARNAVGVSPPSAPTAPVTPRTARPGKVTGLKALVRKGHVKITWRAAPAATKYRVRISQPDSQKYKRWTTTSKRVFKAKIREGRKYRFQVAAVGPAGRGPTTTIHFKGK